MKKKNIIRALILIAIFASSVIIASSLYTFANGGSSSGDGGDANGGSCAPEGATIWEDECFGTTWRSGTVTSDHIVFTGTNHIPSGTLDGCLSIGANEYYILGFEAYNPTVFRATGSAQQASLGYNKGALRTDYGTRFLRTDISGTYSTAEIQRKYAIAATRDNDGNNTTINGRPWSETASFCWNDAWECPPDDPTCVPTPTPPSGSGFYSTSTVNVAASENGSNGGNGTNITGTASEGQTTTVYFSTDKSSVSVNFRHDLGYNHGTFRIDPGDRIVDTFGDDSNHPVDVETSWNAGGTSGNWSHSATSSGTSGDPGVRNYNATINLPNPGDTYTKCSRIDNYYRTVTMDSKEHITQTATSKVCKINGIEVDCDNYDPDELDEIISGRPKVSHTDYKAEYSNQNGGYSEVCAVVYRREEPSGGAKPPSGTATSNVMFAGESSNITWETNAPYHPTHHATSGDASVYQVPSNIPYSSSLGRSSASTQVMQSGILSSYNESKSVQIPDNVGDKYCHTFDYTYGLYYGVSINGGSPNYTPYGSVSYPLHTVCRTIAKKPSVAIWNSSLLTNGGLLTSKSDRWDSATFGALSGGSRHAYGSWSEYLTIANKGIANFSSGSSLALGSPRIALIDNSTLTIANNRGETLLGHSGIISSSTFRTRLETYLGTLASPLRSDTLTGLNHVTGTQIIRRTGTLKITGNITTNPGNYTSIYELPQVIIFVDGDVEISQNVTQIDAWIIATGKINTCSDFADRNTSADTVRQGGSACTNQLVFNGPVIANKLVLQRSFGSDPLISRRGTFGTHSEKYSAAEVFNLRTDVYLWAYAQAGRYDSSYTESYSRELAPRY